MIYFLGVLYMVGLTVALPLLPEPPQLPHSISAKLKHQEVYTNTPKVDSDSFPIEHNNKEVKEDGVKLHPLVIPPPPELPPFDYSSFFKQKGLKVKYDGSVDSEVEIPVKVVDIKPTIKSVEVIEEESKPIENSKFEEKVQPVEESKSIDEPKATELIFIEEPKSVKEPKFVEEPKPTENPIYIEELKSVDEPKFVEEPKPTENPIYIEELKSVDEPKFVEEPKAVEEPKSIEEPKAVEEPKSVEEPKAIEEPKSVEEPKAVEEPKSVEELKEAPEKPLEDIPVVVQFTIPTTTFLSSLISKFPSLSSFGLSWPFHLPSIFSRPRAVYCDNNINDEIYPY